MSSVCGHRCWHKMGPFESFRAAHARFALQFGGEMMHGGRSLPEPQPNNDLEGGLPVLWREACLSRKDGLAKGLILVSFGILSVPKDTFLRSSRP